MTPSFTRTVMSAAGSILIVALVSAACDGRQPSSSERVEDRARIAAAHVFNDRCARSRLSGWKIRARAAGGDCGILLVETPVILEDSMIEALHYGAADYDVYEGGVRRFSRDHTFRGTAYKDGSGKIWAYDAVTAVEAETAAPCR